MGLEPNKKRVGWVDIAKGLTMLLVIAGHSVFGALRGIIFSFHMPLFFILSGWTYQYSVSGQQLLRRTRKAAVHLLVPAVILIGIGIAVEAVQACLDGGIPATFWEDQALAVLFSSGSRFYIGDRLIDRVGIPWFLIVLFLARSLLDLFHLRLGKGFVPVCILLTVAGVALGQASFWMPLSLDVVAAALLFLLFGQWLKRSDLQKGTWWKLPVCALVWGIGLLIMAWADVRYMEIAARRYPLFPLCYLTAVAGTVMVCCFSVLLCRLWAPVRRVLLTCGEHSLLLLCVHTLDYLWEDLYLQIHSRDIVCAAVRVVVDLAVFALVMLIKRFLDEYIEKRGKI